MVQNFQRNTFPRRYRLTNAAEYQQVFVKPIRSADSCFTLLARPKKHGDPRLGVIVSKKNIARAVQRNRIKRIVRDSFRTHKHIIGSHDVIVICKKDCQRKQNKQLFLQLTKHWDFFNKHAE